MAPKLLLNLLLLALLIGACASEAPPPTTSPPAPQDTLTARAEPYRIHAKKHLISGYPARVDSGRVHFVVEIPAGTQAKWEVDKATGDLAWERRNGKPRIVQYLGYPGNYGMVPQTLLPKSAGGDGDPLDALLLGDAQPRGAVIPVRIIGVLRLLDGGEQDDKLIAVGTSGPFAQLQTWAQLQTEFPGVAEIVATWFTHYKGPGEMVSQGYGDERVARSLLETAVAAYAASTN
ncbi:MAG: inorganic diphosphatase [Bacteroidota bacterium]